MSLATALLSAWWVHTTLQVLQAQINHRAPKRTDKNPQ